MILGGNTVVYVPIVDFGNLFTTLIATIGPFIAGALGLGLTIWGVRYMFAMIKELGTPSELGAPSDWKQQELRPGWQRRRWRKELKDYTWQMRQSEKEWRKNPDWD